MEIRVLHVLQSTAPTAGSVAVCLPGLIEAHRKLGIDGKLVDYRTTDFSPGDVSLIHIHGWKDPAAHQLARRARQSKIPYVISPQGSWPPDRASGQGLIKRLQLHFSVRPLLRTAAAIAAVNDAEMVALKNDGTHDRIALLPYGLAFGDVDSSATSRTNQGSRELLLLGPLDPGLGCVAALKAFAEIGPAADQWRMTLAGHDPGDWRGKLEAAVRRKGGADRVVFQDADSPALQTQLLDRAALLVAPSLQISPAVSIMQAMDRGVPVVATNRIAPPGLREGLRVCDANRAEIAREMRSMMDMSEAQRRELAASARARARDLFDWSSLAPQYADFYRACLRN